MLRLIRTRFSTIHTKFTSPTGRLSCSTSSPVVAATAWRIIFRSSLIRRALPMARVRKRQPASCPTIAKRSPTCFFITSPASGQAGRTVMVPSRATRRTVRLAILSTSMPQLIYLSAKASGCRSSISAVCVRTHLRA